MKVYLLLISTCLTISAGQNEDTAAESNAQLENAVPVPESDFDVTKETSSQRGLSEAEVEDKFPKFEDGVLESLERPKNLIVVAASQRTISLRWDFSPASGNIDGYRIYYIHENFKDVKTVLKATPAYDLHGLGKSFRRLRDHS